MPVNSHKIRRDGAGRDYVVITIDSRAHGLRQILMDLADWREYEAEVSAGIYLRKDDRGLLAVFCRTEGGRKRETELHHWVLRRERADRPACLVHVRDGNLLDVRRSNLELRTRSEVGHRTERAAKRSGLPRGVTRSGNGDKPYMARLWVDGQHLFLGQFATPEEAHAAYVAAKRQHGL